MGNWKLVIGDWALLIHVITNLQSLIIKHLNPALDPFSSFVEISQDCEWDQSANQEADEHWHYWTRNILPDESADWYPHDGGDESADGRPYTCYMPYRFHGQGSEVPE